MERDRSVVVVGAGIAGLAAASRLVAAGVSAGGTGLSASRRRELEKAKELLSARIAKAKGKDKEAA